MKKMNNKGFSLVELIIVIAIMAILVAVLAPTYLKFVERSRKSTDCQNVTEIITALQTYAADPMITSNQLGDGAITLTTTETAPGTTNATGNADKALEAAGITKIGLKSSKWTASGNVQLDVDVDDTKGTVSVTMNGATATVDITKGLYQ